MKIKAAYFGKSLANKLFTSMRRFPVSLLFAAVTAFIFIFLQHNEPLLAKASYDLTIRIAMTCALGIPLSLCVKALFERMPNLKRLWKIAWSFAALAMLLYFFFLLKQQNMVSSIRYTGFTLAFYITFTFIPYFYKRENYAIYVVKLITSLFITYLYSMILYGGLSAILFTLYKLFNVHINSKLYIDMLLIVIGVFAPAFFFSEIPQQNTEMQIQNFPKVIRVLIIYIVMPIITAYSLILYAYFAKIIIQRQWPNGLISNLVLWYSLICILVIFMIYPIRANLKWTRRFISWFPKLILPLLIMMFISMGIRIGEYGITESRYYVVLAGLWVFASMLYLAFSKGARVIFFAISLALLCIISTIGPLSSYSISMYSQNKRFEDILAKNQMLRNNILTKAPESISNEDKRELVSIITYFNKTHGLDKLKYTPKGFKINDVQNVLGFDPDSFRTPDYSGMNYFNFFLDRSDTLFSIKDYSYFCYFSEVNIKSPSLSGKDISLSYSPDSNILKILQKNKTLYQVSLLDIASKIYKDNEGKNTLSKGQLSYTAENENVKILLVFNQISGTYDKASSKITINPPEFYIFVKLKNQ